MGPGCTCYLGVKYSLGAQFKECSASHKTQGIIKALQSQAEARNRSPSVPRKEIPVWAKFTVTTDVGNLLQGDKFRALSHSKSKNRARVGVRKEAGPSHPSQQTQQCGARPSHLLEELLEASFIENIQLLEKDFLPHDLLHPPNALRQGLAS